MRRVYRRSAATRSLAAGHAHAGVYLVLSLIMLRYVDEAVLSPFWKWLARTGAPTTHGTMMRRGRDCGRQ
jgi:drug/metabolite transporter superfamily protein YnfA